MNQFCPPNSSDDRCLLFCINPSSIAWYRRQIEDERLNITEWEAQNRCLAGRLYSTVYGLVQFKLKYNLAQGIGREVVYLYNVRVHSSTI